MARISPLMIAPPLVFAGFVALAAVGMFRDDPDALPSARAGQPAPPVVLSEMAGKALFDDADLRDGQIKLVNFWASWCAPCRAEHPNLMKMSQSGIPVYGVNYKDQADNAEGFLVELGDPYAGVGQDPQGRMALDWGVYGVPETYLVDADGTILTRVAGPLTQRVIKEQVEPLLRDAQADN
ncbi:MAG: DsbE family thiol:disulfide interchange protein [Pseudomonadota bacterium]